MHKISIDTAKDIARLLFEKTNIKGVDIFGSVARQGYGADLDLIILADKERAQRWWAGAKMRIQKRSFFTIVYHRLKKIIPFFEIIFERKKRGKGVSLASSIFNYDLSSFFGNYKPKIKVDLVVLPENWRDGDTLNYEIIKKLNPSPDKGTILFFERIAKDSKRLV